MDIHHDFHAVLPRHRQHNGIKMVKATVNPFVVFGEIRIGGTVLPRIPAPYHLVSPEPRAPSRQFAKVVLRHVAPPGQHHAAQQRHVADMRRVRRDKVGVSARKEYIHQFDGECREVELHLSRSSLQTERKIDILSYLQSAENSVHVKRPPVEGAVSHGGRVGMQGHAGHGIWDAELELEAKVGYLRLCDSNAASTYCRPQGLSSANPVRRKDA